MKIHQKLTSLGIAVVVVSIVAIAPPTAQAQERHPYVVHLNEQCRLPGCAVLPATWQECGAIRDQQELEEDERYRGVLQKLYDHLYNLIVRSEKIYTDAKRDIDDECEARIDAAEKKAAAAVIAAQAQLVACELAITATGPAFWVAQSLCLTKHSVALAGIYMALEYVKEDAEDDWYPKWQIIGHERDNRNDAINARMDAQEVAAQRHHAAIFTDIESEYDKCMDYIARN